MEQELKEELQEEEQTPDETQETTPPADSAEEERARVTGWVPKKEFRGDVTKWRPAGEWNKHAETMLPIAKAAMRRLEDDNAALRKEVAITKDTLSRMVKVQEKFGGDFYETKLAELNTQIDEAVNAADVARFRELDGQRAKLVKPEPVKMEAETNPADMLHPDIKAWAERNPWLESDADMGTFTVVVHKQLIDAGSPLVQAGNEKALCAEMERRVKTAFPHKFTNPNRSKGDLDEASVRGAETTTTKDWNDLPPDAKAQCIEFMKRNPRLTKEKYVQSYFEQ